MKRANAIPYCFPENEEALTSTCGRTEVLSYRVIGLFVRCQLMFDAELNVDFSVWKRRPRVVTAEHRSLPLRGQGNRRQRFTAGPHCCFFTISISSDCCAERLVPRCSFMTFNSGAWVHKHSAHPQTDPCPTANVRPALMLIPLQLPCFWA